MIIYQTQMDGVESSKLTGFFVGWPTPPSEDVLFQVLTRAYRRVLAIDEQDGRVIGFVNAVSDGILSAYIPLLEVLPEYQGRGIGSSLMERMLKQLEHLYMVDIVCDETVVPFYQRMSFHQLHGMAYRNFEHQNGQAGLIKAASEG